MDQLKIKELTQSDYFQSYIASRFDAIKTMFAIKNAEYAGDANIYQAFIDATSGMSFHTRQQAFLWELMVKHLNSIRDYCGGKDIDSGKLREKISDIILYLMILEGMHEEQLKSKPNGTTI